MDNVSNAKLTKILSNYHLKIDRRTEPEDEVVMLRCDRGWVFSNKHQGVINRECLNDLGYVIGLLDSNVRPCHCPECMSSDDWVHELSYLRPRIMEVCARLGIVYPRWDEKNHTVAGLFYSDVYEEEKPVFIQWKEAPSKLGFVVAYVAMNNWDAVNNCRREPIKKRVVYAPSTNSLYTALMAVRGDMHTPISYSFVHMDSEATEALAEECAANFANVFIHRVNYERPESMEFYEKEHSVSLLNKRDERVIRNNEIWWASMFEPDDAIRRMKTQQAELQQGISGKRRRGEV